MTVSTFYRLVRLHLSANSLYSSRKSSIGWLISLVKQGASLDQMDGMAPMPYAGVYGTAGAGIGMNGGWGKALMCSGCSKYLAHRSHIRC